jgi:hypothetical protein
MQSILCDAWIAAFIGNNAQCFLSLRYVCVRFIVVIGLGSMRKNFI